MLPANRQTFTFSTWHNNFNLSLVRLKTSTSVSLRGRAGQAAAGRQADGYGPAHGHTRLRCGDTHHPIPIGVQSGRPRRASLLVMLRRGAKRPAVLSGERAAAGRRFLRRTLSHCLPIVVGMTTRVLQLLQELAACFGRVAASDEGRQAWELAIEIAKQLSNCSVDGENVPLLRE